MIRIKGREIVSGWWIAIAVGLTLLLLTVTDWQNATAMGLVVLLFPVTYRFAKGRAVQRLKRGWLR
jgi:hypothetical protein